MISYFSIKKKKSNCFLSNYFLKKINPVNIKNVFRTPVKKDFVKHLFRVDNMGAFFYFKDIYDTHLKNKNNQFKGERTWIL